MLHERNALPAAVLLLAIWLFFATTDNPLGDTVTAIIAIAAGVLAVVAAKW
jgi:hypothetical protein